MTEPVRFAAPQKHKLAVGLLLGAIATGASAQGEPPAGPSAGSGVSVTGPQATPRSDAPTAASEQVTPGATGRPAGEAAPTGTESRSATIEQTVPDVGALLPKDLTPWGMFLSADIVVKAVMIGLALASLVTWTIALAKGWEVFAAKRRLRRELRVLAQSPTLSEANRQLGEGTSLAVLIGVALTEVRRSADSADRQGIKERVALTLERIEAAAGRRMARATGVLATIGAIAPFVGLFGTVWGIMNSFIGISRLHTTNLAVVAPGIAEALLATALGLFAAIPAVVIYNIFSRSITSYRALHGDATAEVRRLASRDLDRTAG
jgi:biopolymer transport protein ExbB